MFGKIGILECSMAGQRFARACIILVHWSPSLKPTLHISRIFFFSFFELKDKNLSAWVTVFLIEKKKSINCPTFNTIHMLSLYVHILLYYVKM